LIAVVVLLLCAGAAGLAAGRTLDGSAATARPVCKRVGIRFIGTATSKSKVCFTLTANRRTMREYSYELCPASDLAGKAWSWRGPIPVRANGTFKDKMGIEAVASGDAGPGFVNVTFSGRILSARASGTLTGEVLGSPVLSCTWTARRVSG